MDFSLVCLANKAVTQFQELFLSKKDDPTILSVYLSAFSIASIKPCFQQGLHMSNFPQIIVEICQLHTLKGNEVVLRKGIQLLGNITVQNEPGKEKVWNLCYPEFITEMLDSSYDLTELICFLIFNCLDCSRATKLFSSPRGIGLISQLLFELTKEGSGDFCQLLLSRILLDYKGSVMLYSLFNETKKFTSLLLLLDFVFQSNEFHILSMHESSHLEVCTNLIEMFYKDFLILKPILYQAISILEERAIDQHDIITKAEIFKSILAILALFSGFSELLTHLQSLEILLRECLTILDSLIKYSQPKIVSNSSPAPHPPISKFLYGIKQNIMQIVANMLYSNYHNVNLVYEDKTLLILILNHCSPDMSNPFLTQWTILAIRNLCQDPRVQLLISELKKLGIDPNSVMSKRGFNSDANT
ncbi:Ataxin-10 [Oopsacas minuta]|uniref:Ataxin-10 n=1 Tax=Oopsacas minuta TaxID=111878 RepID=A0AAV7JXB9_9METZ|nr:Ataxin-10 [Oopsacas minuta]